MVREARQLIITLSRLRENGFVVDLVRRILTSLDYKYILMHEIKASPMIAARSDETCLEESDCFVIFNSLIFGMNEGVAKKVL